MFQSAGFDGARHLWVVRKLDFGKLRDGYPLEITVLNFPSAAWRIATALTGKHCEPDVSQFDRPLGIELNMKVVEQLRMADPLTLTQGVYSDTMFGKDNFPSAVPHVKKG